MKRGSGLAASLAVVAAIGIGACSNGDSDGSGGYGTGPPGSGPNRELNSGNIGPGAIFVHAFANAGTFAYRCTLHPCMTSGSVAVAMGQADSAVVNITTPGGGCQGAYTPQNVSIRPGGSVRWVNQSTTHTVTSP